MGADAAYALTRRKGKPGVITQVLDSTANPETGEQVDTTCDTNVRWMAKEPTKYNRIYRAQATQQDVGETTFTIWSKDVPSITRLNQDSYITWGGLRYEVVTSGIEQTAFVITARETALGV